MTTALALSMLDRLPAGIARPAYRPSQLTPGIVHFGVGNFHRAHQSVYLDLLMNDGKAHDWGIIGAGVRASDTAMRDAFRGGEQDLICVYRSNRLWRKAAMADLDKEGIHRHKDLQE